MTNNNTQEVVDVESNSLENTGDDNMNLNIDIVKDKANDLVVLDPSLIEQFPKQEEQKMLFELKAKYGGSVDKLFELNKEINQKSLDDTVKLFKEKGYSVDKVEDMLGTELVEKLKELDDTYKGIKNGDLTKKRKEEKKEEEKEKKGIFSKAQSKLARMSAVSVMESIKAGAVIIKEEVVDLKEQITRNYDYLDTLIKNEPFISKAIEELNKEKERKYESYKKMYDEYIKLSFILSEVDSLLAEINSQNHANDIHALETEREREMLNYLKAYTEDGKAMIYSMVLIEMKNHNRYEIAGKRYELIYNTTEGNLRRTIDSMLSNEKYGSIIEQSLKMQDTNDVVKKSYFNGMNNVMEKDVMVNETIAGSIKVTSELLANSKTQIEQFDIRMGQIEGDIHSNIDDLNTNVADFEKVFKNRDKYYEMLEKK